MSGESGTSEDQWYKKHPELYQMEIDAMKTVCPEASHGFLDTGQMYWIAPCFSIANGQQKKWTLFLLYDSDYPHRDHSVRCYPIKPNYDEIKRTLLESEVIPKTIPHCIQDEKGMVYFSTERAGDDGIITSATSELRRAFRWIYYFECGVQDQNIWNQWRGIR